MKRLITLDDFIETYAKLHQRGFQFISSKFKIDTTERAKTAFNHAKIESSNWWIIPKVKERWLQKITKDKTLSVEQFTMDRFLKDKQNLSMLSLGSGECATELVFAEYANFKDILCTDIADIRLKKAQEKARAKGLKNIRFQIQDANKLSELETQFDVIYFRASLHHFKSIEKLLSIDLKAILKPNGFLIIDEYVGPSRLQFPKHQIKAINTALREIPKVYRTRYKLNLAKQRVYGPGVLRMVLADPSECVDSASIMPTIHKHYTTVYEAGYGGNILTLVLKDIAHHFVDLNDEKTKILNHLFDYEDNYLKKHPSDFIFGVYKPNKT